MRVAKCCACHEICTSRFTCDSSDKAFCRKRASKDNIKIPKRSFCARRSPISENDPHVQKSRFTAPVTKLERVEDHYHVQSAAPATKSAFRSKTTPIPCARHEKSTLHQQSTRFCHEKWPPCPKMCTAPQRERSCDKHPPRPLRFCERAQSKCTSSISRGMNVRAVNSSEFAAIRHRCSTIAVRIPSVSTLLGGKPQQHNVQEQKYTPFQAKA